MDKATRFYLDGFRTFLKIGLFTIGGGYAMIPLIESEVVERNKWLEREEFLDILAVAQACPGVFAINMSVYIGYRMKGVKGALCTCAGTALPSFLIILAIAMFFSAFRENRAIAAAFRGIRPAVVALIAMPVFNLARSAGIRFSNCWIPIACALAIWALGMSPVLVIVIAGAAGYLYGRFTK